MFDREERGSSKGLAVMGLSVVVVKCGNGRELER